MKRDSLAGRKIWAPIWRVSCHPSTLLACALVALPVGSAFAQFVAFNDHYQGTASSNNATFWNVYTNLSGAPGNSGPLKNITNGLGVSNGAVAITLTITNNGLPTGVRLLVGSSTSTDPSLNYIMGFDNLSIVPEPSHVALLGLGALLLVWRLRRNKAK